MIVGSINEDRKIESRVAITPDNVTQEFQKTYLQWTWPWMGQEPCMKTGLIKSAYQTADPNKRVACFVSHYRGCREVGEPFSRNLGEEVKLEHGG